MSNKYYLLTYLLTCPLDLYVVLNRGYCFSYRLRALLRTLRYSKSGRVVKLNDRNGQPSQTRRTDSEPVVQEVIRCSVLSVL